MVQYGITCYIKRKLQFKLIIGYIILIIAVIIFIDYLSWQFSFHLELRTNMDFLNSLKAFKQHLYHVGLREFLIINTTVELCGVFRRIVATKLGK